MAASHARPHEACALTLPKTLAPRATNQAAQPLLPPPRPKQSLLSDDSIEKAVAMGFSRFDRDGSGFVERSEALAVLEVRRLGSSSKGAVGAWLLCRLQTAPMTVSHNTATSSPPPPQRRRQTVCGLLKLPAVPPAAMVDAVFGKVGRRLRWLFAA
jgi:hypothetical protein